MNEYDVMYNAKMSFVHYIKEIFLKKVKYITIKNKNILSVTSGKSYEIESDIVNTDEYGDAKNMISVTSNNEDVSDSEFEFNYLTNKITFLDSFKNVNVMYKKYLINVIDAYPNIENTSFDSPIISVELEDFASSPFEIGTRRKYWNGNIFIDCFCINDAMRERIRGALTFELANRNIPVYDFVNNSLLNIDGTLNKDFMFSNSETEIYDITRISAENYDMNSLNKKKMSVCSISANFNLIF